MPAHAYTIRTNLGGNFCGHDPANPSLSLLNPAKKGKGGLPRVLTLCSERLQDFYYRPRKVIPTLDRANGSSRQQRSERREACILLLRALLKRVDLTSLRVGMPTASGFLNYTVNFIARETGMNIKRVERALRDLKAAGLVTVSQPRQMLPDGSWKGLAAVKAISRHLFAIMGLGEMLKKEREKASKRLRKKTKEWEQQNANSSTRTGRARLSLFMGNISKPPKKTRSIGQVLKGGAPPSDFDRRELMLKAAEIKASHMDWDSEKCNKEARKALSRSRFART